MQIHSKGPGPVTPDATQTASRTDATQQVAVPAVVPTQSSTDRTDKVEISDAGRALAAREVEVPIPGLEPARAANIRNRVLSGAYDSLSVVDTVARRLLVSGDL